MEISRIMKFIIQRGAIVTVKAKHYRRSLGDLELPCEISLRTSGSMVNHKLLQRYEILLIELYTEAKEEVVGTLLSDMEASAINFSVKPRQKNN